MFSISLNKKVYLETESGEKIEVKCASHCLCMDCCRERKLINDKIIAGTLKLAYYPKLEKCPYGSKFKEKYAQHIEEMKIMEKKLSKTCDDILIMLKGCKQNDI